jgi:hypothetical protein
MNTLLQKSILNFLQATADDAMGMEPGDRHMANEAKKYIEHLEAMLKESNDVLRSAAEIAQRNGKKTNWDGFRIKLAKVLLAQAKELNGDKP